MYRLFLAIRYLLTRPINLLGMGGITISVWALVVVATHDAELASRAPKRLAMRDGKILRPVLA